MSLSLSGWQQISFVINGLKYYVPSNRLIFDIVLSVPDQNSIELLLEQSNFLTPRIANQLVAPINDLVKPLCDLLGDSWTAYQRHQAIVDYCRALLPAELPHSQQRIALEFLSYRKRDTEHFPAWNESSILLEFEEYRSAIGYLQSFWERAFESNDPLVQSLIQSYLNALERQSLDNRKLPSVTSQSLTTKCLYCGRVFRFRRGRGINALPATCGANECQRGYKRQEQDRNRERKTPERWEPVGSKKKRCIDCRKQRLVNSDRLCKKCFSGLLEQ